MQGAGDVKTAGAVPPAAAAKAMPLGPPPGVQPMDVPPVTLHDVMARFDELGSRVDNLARNLIDARQEHGNLHKAVELEIKKLEARVKATEEAMAKPTGTTPGGAEDAAQRSLDRLCEKAELPRFDGTGFRK